MTRDEFEAHIQRITEDPTYGVGFRAGLAGRAKMSPYDAVDQRALWDDGWQAGTAETAKAGGALDEFRSSTRRKVRP